MLEFSTNGLWINNGKTFIHIERVKGNRNEFCLSVMDDETGSKSCLMKREQLLALSAYAEYNAKAGKGEQE
ncbi:hypothetical protein B488_09050 [Liberibacter crescens BT-1]|uniref:Uncharacterized protein n=1 Tax=Liberibacter crescens (strain BT-1) TaxID=1215343 RepID=L0EVB3_LIBCB|nr:hypothetical protein [Liberibacter crescens]AGA64897.1 hypothetical protein B488_09050 [Liberibacter crescens BT-1]AMC12928.1 hypothetical protein RL73_04565 [Liberibacter crescens]